MGTFRGTEKKRTTFNLFHFKYVNKTTNEVSKSVIKFRNVLLIIMRVHGWPNGISNEWISNMMVHRNLPTLREFVIEFSRLFFDMKARRLRGIFTEVLLTWEL